MSTDHIFVYVVKLLFFFSNLLITTLGFVVKFLENPELSTKFENAYNTLISHLAVSQHIGTWHKNSVNTMALRI